MKQLIALVVSSVLATSVFAQAPATPVTPVPEASATAKPVEAKKKTSKPASTTPKKSEAGNKPAEEPAKK